jgi:hypothetical protein
MTGSLTRIISGGQTGVDRGALDAALELSFPCGGWCPDGRQAEDGVIPDRYPVAVLAGAGYRARTRQNVEDSDATLILSDGELTGGTAHTKRFCTGRGRPCLVVDAAAMSPSQAAKAVVAFLGVPGRTPPITVLNVAGPRATGWPDGYAYARAVVRAVIQAVR